MKFKKVKLSQLEIYNRLYKNKYFVLLSYYTEDKASRVANKYAVQNTWEAYNVQHVSIRI